MTAWLWGYQPYGLGKPGTNGLVPEIAGRGRPLRGEPVVVDVSSVTGGTIGAIGVSFAGPADIPIGGGSLLLASPTTAFWGVANGPVGVPGAGTASLPLRLPADRLFHGQRVNFQGFALDACAIDGFSSTQGLEMWIW